MTLNYIVENRNANASDAASGPNPGQWFAGHVVALVAVCALLLGFAGPLHAQLSTATMFGTITDSTGAVLSGATITMVQTDTNFTRVAVTKDDGSYREEFLPVGPYKVTVAAKGFKTLDRTGIVLSVMQDAELSLKLEVGATSETVDVTADVPLVNLGNSTLGATVSNLQIDNLPLVGRNTYQLLNLTPGVQSNNITNSLGFQELHVYINGSTDDFTGQVSYYLDGGLNMTGLRNSGNNIPNPDAISQFNVETNNFSAQLGRYAAAVVSVVTNRERISSMVPFSSSTAPRTFTPRRIINRPKATMPGTSLARRLAARFVTTRISSSEATPV